MERKGEDQTWIERVTSSLYGLSLSERQLRNRRRGRFIFTDKKHPWRGVFSVIIGVFSLMCSFLSVLLTYRSGTEANGNYAIGIFLALGYAVTGFVMGILSGREREIYPAFPRAGIAVNALALLCVAGITYLGLAG